MSESRNQFDWLIYADATFAGLSVLIPIPFVDTIFEGIFRRRMPKAIARRRGLNLDPLTVKRLGQGGGCLQWGCLLLPLWAIFELLKRISRKILYFLTIKEATDQVSHYWHRAFLLDHMMAAGYVSGDRPVIPAVTALNQVLSEIETSPLIQLAQQIVSNTRHTLRTLIRVIRRDEEDEVVEENKIILDEEWARYNAYFNTVAGAFEAAYAKALKAYEAEIAAEAAKAEAEAAERAAASRDSAARPPQDTPPSV